MKKCLSILLCLAMAVCLVACSGGINTDEAKAHITSFLEAVEQADYEATKTYLHPDRPADLATFFANVESKEGLDFSAGIQIERFTGFSYSYYDSTVGGSACAWDIQLTVGTQRVEAEIEVVSNENGYGIYNFEIDT